MEQQDQVGLVQSDHPIEYETLFQGFLLHVQAFVADVSVAEWSGPPLMELVTLGIVMVTRAIAAKAQVSLRTEEDFVKLGPRVEYLLVVGLGRRYADPAEAALAFKKRVFDTTMKTLASAPRDMKAFDGVVKAFGQRVTDFFLDLLRASQEEADELRRLCHKIEAINRPFRSGRMEYVEFSVLETYFGEVIEGLSLNSSQDHLFGTFVRKMGDTDTAQKADALQRSPTYGKIDQLKRTIEEVRALQLLPVRPVELAALKEAMYPSVGGHWIRTQLVLVGAGFPDAETLLSESISSALALAARCSSEDLVERFWTRMGERGCDVARARPKLEEKVRFLAEGVIRTGTGTVGQIDKHTFLVKYVTEQTMTHQEAIRLASCEPMSPNSSLGEKILYDEQYTRVVLPRTIDWKRVTCKEFEKMLCGEWIPREILLSMAAQMSPKERAKLPTAFLAYTELLGAETTLGQTVIQEIIQAAERLGLPHGLRNDAVDPFLGKTPAQAFAALPTYLLERSSEKDIDSPRLDSSGVQKIILRELARLTSEEIANLMGRRDLRPVFVMLLLLTAFRFDRHATPQEKKKASVWISATLCRIPCDLAIQYIVGELAQRRGEAYDKRSAARPWIPLWEVCLTQSVQTGGDMSWVSCPDLLVALVAVAGKRFSVVRDEIPHKMREEDAYAWSRGVELPDDPSRASIVKEFLDARDAYFDAARACGMPDILEQMNARAARDADHKKRGGKKKK